MTRSWTGIARPIFFILGALFLALAFARTWNEMQSRVLPSYMSLAAGGVAILIALGCSAFGWAALFERPDLRASLVYWFFVSQLGKYIPGGIWQFVGQVGFATDAGVPLARTSAALPVHIVVQVAAGGSIGALAGVLAPSASAAWRLIALAAVATVVFLDRRLLLLATRLVARLGMAGATSADLPSQSAVFRSYFWTIGTLLASGAAFALMLSSVDAGSPPAASVVTFALAWLAGFLAVIVPAGLGVRELVLMALLPASAAAIVAVSLCHRILTIAVEWVVLTVARTYSR